MRVLILGGTGVIGTHLIDILSKKNIETFVTSRKKHNSKEFIQYIQGNAKDSTFINKILKHQWDAIVDFMVYTETEFKERIELILESTKHYIFLSSATIYAENKTKIAEDYTRLIDVTIDAEYLIKEPYAIVKARQEDILISSTQKNWTIIRPYITYSEQRLQLGNLEKEDWLFRALHGKTIVFSSDMKKCITTLTYGHDVAKGIANMINNEKSLGEIYNITSNKSCTWQNILEIYLDILNKNLGYRPKIIYQRPSDYLRWNHNKFQIIYDRQMDRKFDNTKINSIINTEEFLPFELGIKENLELFLKNPKFKKINWGKEGIKDKITNEITPLREISGLKSKLVYYKKRFL